MEPYVYANLGKEKYTRASSVPEYFNNINNKAAMDSFLRYDSNIGHGELKTTEHQSFWMLTTDLDIPGEPPRLFVQVSGADPFRSGFYVCGYMGEGSSVEIYRNSPLSKLLTIRFPDLDGTLRKGSQGNLQSEELDQIALDQSLTPLELQPERFESILLALLQRKRVIVRIPSVGREAMLNSRRLLLSIYQRLPYEYRSYTGAITGCAPDTIHNVNNPLPGAVGLFLVDGDTDLSGFSASGSETVIDLCCPDFQRAKLEDKNGPLVYAGLIHFLARADLKRLEKYFDVVQKIKEEKQPDDILEIRDLALIHEYEAESEGGKGEPDDREIRHFALTLKRISPKFREYYIDQLRTRLTMGRLTRYLEETITSYSQLKTYGNIDEVELENIKLDKTGTLEAKDRDCGLVLEMLTKIADGYSEPVRELYDRLTDSLGRCFLRTAHSSYPELTALEPDAGTMTALDGIPLGTCAEKPKALADRIRVAVWTELREEIASVKKRHEDNLVRQKAEGLEIIRHWDFDLNIAMLFSRLQQRLYLYDELVGNAEWNPEIGKRMTEALVSVMPLHLQDAEFLRDKINGDRKTFEDNRGVLTAEEVNSLEAKKDWCSRTLLRREQVCHSLKELLEQAAQADGDMQSEVLSIELKELWLGKLPEVTRRELVECTETDWDLMISNSWILEQVIGKIPSLSWVEDCESLKDTLRILRALDKLQNCGLVKEPVQFVPWKMQGPAAGFTKRIECIRNYRWGMQAPNVNAVPIQEWILKRFPDNMDLAALLALRCPERRPDMIRKLAADGKMASVDFLRSMYCAGCSRRMLEQGAGAKTAQSWKLSVGELFRGPVPMPEISQWEFRSSNKKALIAAETVLLGLIGLVTAAAPYLSGLPVRHAAGTSFGLLILAVVLLATSMHCRRKDQRKMAMRLAWALLPGVFTSLAVLALAALAVL